MIASMDRWITFRGMSCCVVVGLGLGLASAALAQETPTPTPAQPPQAAQPGQPALPKPAGQSDETAWVKLCMKNEQTQNKQVCLINHEGLEPNTGMVLVAAAVRTIEGDAKQHLLVRLPTAYSLIIPAGVQIKIDDQQPLSLQYAVCFPTSCQVQTELTQEMFDKMRKGKQMIVAAVNMQQKTMAFPVPLSGFSKAYDGAPVDNAQYEQARRAMMEKFKQRQQELAEKAAEAQQKKAQGGAQRPGAATPQATPATPATPPSTPTP
jgi:invasion protein IalB